MNRLEKNYGITADEYDALAEAQGGCCAICKRKPRMSDKRMAVDHDHVTGVVRGLLCSRCNWTLLGLFEGLIEEAYHYLNCPPAPTTLGREQVIPSMQDPQPESETE